MTNILIKVLRTNDDRMLTVLRIVLGAVMFAHGAQRFSVGSMVPGWERRSSFSGGSAFRCCLRCRRLRRNSSGDSVCCSVCLVALQRSASAST